MHPQSLCLTCRSRREIRNARGSVFWLCELSRQNPAYAKYPLQPVKVCNGYQSAENTGGKNE